MITLALLLAQATAALSLTQVRELSPAAAGDAVLRDQQHGPIDTFEAPTGGMNAPGVIDGQLVEQPTASGSGCVRRRWTVRFRAASGADINTAVLEGVMYSTQEVFPSPDGICPSGRYVHLNPGVSVNQGLQALAKLNEVSTGAGRAQLRCSDSTSSGLCNGSEAIRVALRTLTPWAISHDAGDVVIWLGVPGGVLTEARFRSFDTSQVIVTRYLPAPF